MLVVFDNNVLNMCSYSYIGTRASFLTDLKNGTEAVELPNRVFSALEHVCYLFAHGKPWSMCATYLVLCIICTNGRTDGHMDGRTNTQTHIMWIRAHFWLK